MSPAPTMQNDETVDATISALPQVARISRGAVAMAWWSVCSAMVYLFLGAALALAHGTRNALVGITIAVCVFSVINGPLARYAVQTGLSCAALSRRMLGNVGASIATLILAATGVYYAVFEGSVLAVAMSRVIPSLSYRGAAILIALYSTPIVLGSVQRWLNRLNGALLPCYLAGLVMVALLPVLHHGYSNAWLHLEPAGGAQPFGWWPCLTTYLGVLILSMVTMDFARFGRPTDADFHALVTFGAPFYLLTFLVNGAVGIFLVASLDAQSISETAVVEASLLTLGPIAGLAWVWVTQTRINTANYLLGALNLQALTEEVVGARIPKAICAAVVGGVVLALTSFTDVFSYLLTALSYQGILVTAWVGVALSYVIGRPVTADDEPVVTAVSRPGLIAWLAGALVGFAIMMLGGPIASASVPVTLAVSVGVHKVMSWAPAMSRITSS